jgi:hypothetical protein
MNTLNVMTITRNRWFHLGVIALVSILLSWALVLHVVTSIQIHVPEVGRQTPSAVSAARQRFNDFKQAQVEGMGGARVSAPSAAKLRFEDFKLRQIEERRSPIR